MTEDAAKIHDPRNLIREAFRIDGIGREDCRSIFFDWALGLKDDQDARTAVTALMAIYADAPADHPMMIVLREALETPPKTRRRGGAAARR